MTLAVPPTRLGAAVLIVLLAIVFLYLIGPLGRLIPILAAVFP